MHGYSWLKLCIDFTPKHRCRLNKKYVSYIKHGVLNLRRQFFTSLTLLFVDSPRGLQYVHYVMHKCIMVKVGGKQNTHKVCKKLGEFFENRGEVFKVGRS